MNVSDFDFDLPDELIAQHAIARGASRLLVLDRASGIRRHTTIAELPSILARGDLLVVNNTRVIAARLLGHRVPSGGAVECLLLGPTESPTTGSSSVADAESPDEGHRPASVGRASPGGVRIADALMHPGQKLKPGALVRFAGEAGVLLGEVVARHFYGRRTIRLWVDGGGDVDAMIETLGHMPLPPYIKRSDTSADRERYQTIFARVRGSVAAPTAGLHFTPELLSQLDDRGVERVEITLHVGYGTFKPVRVTRVEDHVVDPEHYEIPVQAEAAIARAKRDGRRVIAVGTTTTRALEDAATRGDGRVLGGTGTASLFIYPGYRFRSIDGLLTNFHLPSSSLLMLVSAFAGTDAVLAAYREAVAQRYRFYSYGDAMLVV
jgi:S-adenosylmethionine:tRNA ribosyltransferase-isomerase